MTFCLVWNYVDAVCVVADSVKSTPGATSQVAISSFGDNQAQDPDVAREEGTLKIIPIYENGFVTFSGSVPYARAFVAALLHAVGSLTIDRAILAASDATCDHRDRGRPLVILVGLCPAGAAQTLRWTSETPERVEEIAPGTATAIGNLAPHHRDQLLEVAAHVAGGGAGASAVPLMTASLQLKAMQENLIKDGIGGACIGGAVTVDGFSWQDDTTFALYTPKSFKESKIDLITTLVRDNVPVVASSITESRSIFFDDLACPLMLPDWQRKWMAPIDDDLASFRSRYFAFLSKAYPKVTVVESPTGTGRTGLFVLERADEKRVHFTTRSEFQKELLSPPLDDDGQPSRFQGRFIAVSEQPQAPASIASIRKAP